MRPSRDDYLMAIAVVASLRSTCRRRSVGCVFADEDGKILSTGYNGVGKHEAHCIDEPCIGANLPPGSGLDKCAATHAEINAIAQCKSLDKIHSIYVTAQPCIFCLRALKATSALVIMYLNPYPGSQLEDGWNGPKSKARQSDYTDVLTKLIVDTTSELTEFTRL
jgi:dCMP deaminase